MPSLSLEVISDPVQWNTLVASLPITSALQSWGWGEVKRLSGWIPHRLTVYQGDTLVGAAQVLSRSLGGPVGLLYAPRGPALRRLEDLPAVAQVLSQRLPGSYLTVEPEYPWSLEEPTPAWTGLYPAEAIQPERTIWLDLTQGEERVLAGMKPKHRYNTRLASKKGVVATIHQDFEVFWPLFEETNRRARLLQHSRSYYEAVLREMNQPGGAAFLSTAWLEGLPLAAGLFVAFGGRIDYLYGGSSRERPEVMAPYLMHFEAIRWGIAHGYSIYDLWGIPRNPEGSHAAGIYRFKEGFGGQQIRFLTYDCSRSRLYPLLRKALRLRKSWMNYRSLGTPRDIL